jgi:hypothetical protein
VLLSPIDDMSTPTRPSSIGMSGVPQGAARRRLAASEQRCALSADVLPFPPETLQE